MSKKLTENERAKIILFVFLQFIKGNQERFSLIVQQCYLLAVTPLEASMTIKGMGGSQPFSLHYNFIFKVE